jgi:hypothetical protein
MKFTFITKDKMCKQCELKPVYEFTNKRKLCKRCFINYFQKKVLYTIRKFQMIQNKDRIGHNKTPNFRDVVLEDALKMFSEKTNIELIKLTDKRKTNKIAVSSTIDLEANKISRILIKGNSDKLNQNLPIVKNIIKPLYLFLDEEVLLYAKLRELKFKNTKTTETKIQKFINNLEKKHPEIKRAIVKGYLKLYC